MPPPISAQPLKVASSPSPFKFTEKDSKREKTPTPGDHPQQTPSQPANISSPHELTGFVESLLEQLDTKFEEMSSQILERMGQMSARVDALEASIQDIINGDITVSSSPQSPTIPSAPVIRRSGSD